MKRTLKMNNGLDIPLVGFNGYSLNKNEPFLLALKHGYRHFDSVNMKDIKWIGNKFKKALKSLGLQREDLFISTNLFVNDYDKAKASIEESLKILDLGYIDLVSIFHPANMALKNMDDQIIDTWRVLEEYVDRLQVKSIGLQKFKPIQIDKLLPFTRIKPVVNRVRMNPLFMEHDTIDFCNQNDILIEAQNPLAQYDVSVIENPVIVRIAQKHNIDVARTILLYMVTKGFIVLPQSIQEERIAINIQLEGLPELSIDDIMDLDALGKTHSSQISWKYRAEV